jgi:hypothetical protein
VAVFAGTLYLTGKSADQPATTTPPPPAGEADAESVTPATGTRGIASAATSQPGRTSPVPSDPRLAALMVSPDNGLIEFVVGADGKVIAEIDKDPSSPGFRKPLREYTWSGDKVIGLTSYRYLGDHVEIARTAVSYKPDGSVDRYSESTSLDYGEKKPKDGGR